MALWLKLVILWFIIGTIINFYMRRKLQKYYETVLKDDAYLYKAGFRDGALATKLYQTILGKLPSSNWIDSNCGNTLNTREELIATLDEEDTKNVNLVT
tara:strand:+ start:566 stop:862 length:297 start_codon:yes stop_codon:yes gene_type:complete